MLKLNRTTEYGLIALKHMRQKSELTSAREIADTYGLPFEITAKTLQRLRDAGIIQSAQGARGGYSLSRPLVDVNLGDFIHLMEGGAGVVQCVTDSPAHCEFNGKCEIKHLMSDLNSRIQNFLSSISVDEMTQSRSAPLGLSTQTEPLYASQQTQMAAMPTGEEP